MKKYYSIYKIDMINNDIKNIYGSNNKKDIESFFDIDNLRSVKNAIYKAIPNNLKNCRKIIKNINNYIIIID